MYFTLNLALKNLLVSARFKKAKTCARESRRLVTLYLHNSKPQTAQITKSLFSQANLYWPLPRKFFQNNYLEFTLNGDFFSQLVDFLVILDQYSNKK